MRLMRTSKERLKSRFKCALGVIGLLLVVVLMMSVIKFGYYYYNKVYPYQAIARDIITNAEPEHQHLSPQIQRMIDADFYCVQNPTRHVDFFNEYSCSSPKAYQVTWLLLLNNQQETILHGHIDRALLEYLVIRRLSDKEQNSLISELTYFTPQTQGFNAFSNNYFHKPLSQLTLDEMATLIAITKKPSQYLKHDDRLQQQRERLLARYQLIPSLK